MGIRQEKIRKYDNQTRLAVIARDKEKCVVCGRKGHDVHEIVSRSHFGSTNMDLCFAMKNRVVLCRDHHNQAQGQSKWIKKLLAMLKDKWGYTYEERIFQRYL